MFNMRFVKMSSVISLLLLVFILSGCSRIFTAILQPKPPEQPTTHQPFFAGTNDSGSKPEASASSADSGKLQLDIIEPNTPKVKLQRYDGGFFTIDKPSDWVIEVTGDYENFGFRIYDPDKPQRQMFFYGNMSPFLKSSEAKQAWKSYISSGGFGEAQLYADAPVLSPATTEQFFYTFEAFTELAYNYGLKHNFPSFKGLDIVETTPRNSPISGVSLDDSIVRGLFTDDGLPCEGLFAASVVDAMTSYMYNVDAGYYTVYVISGISAPADEIKSLENALASSLSTFSFSPDYIKAGVAQNQWETNAALQVAKTLSEAYDSYNQAWHDRQTVYDAISQKNSDATLGYDRLYDPETGEVFRAEIGFYDQYDDHRDDYSNSNLQLVPNDGYDLYSQDISGYIYNN